MAGNGGEWRKGKREFQFALAAGATSLWCHGESAFSSLRFGNVSRASSLTKPAPGYQLWPTIGRLEASAQISRCKPDEGDYFMPIPTNTSIDTIDADHQISNSFCMNNGDARFRVP